MKFLFSGKVVEVNVGRSERENSLTVDNPHGLLRLFRCEGPTTAEVSTLLGKRVIVTINVEEVSDETRTASTN